MNAFDDDVLLPGEDHPDDGAPREWQHSTENDAPAKALPDYTACSFALGRGRYCKGDVRFPNTHATLCPGFSARVTSPESP